MAKRGSKSRISALESDPFAYSRDAPKGTVEVNGFQHMPYGEDFYLAGRIMPVDRSGKISRLGIFDVVCGREVVVLERLEGGGASVSAFLERTQENVRMIDSTVHHGDIVLIHGKKRNVPNSDEDVFIGERVELLAKAVEDVCTGNIDFRSRADLYTYRHLQLAREPERLLRFRKCSLALRAIRQFLYGRGFEEITTTLLQKSFEAGNADPFVTHAIDGDRDMFLRVTSEMFLRKLMVAGFSKVFEIGKSFRNQGATASTLPHFTILELYEAYASQEEMEELVRDMIRNVLIELYGEPSIPTSAGAIDCSGKWRSYDFREEIVKYTGSPYDESLSIDDLLGFLDRAGIAHPQTVNKCFVARALYSHVVQRIEGPAFLRNLPAAQSPLFRLNEDGSTLDETALVINGAFVADIVNPERDPRVLRRRMEEQLAYRKEGENNCVNEDLIDATGFGLPPCRGFGIGIERLLMLLLNAGDVRDVDLFPAF